jgi:uncharacterized membrane protein
MVNEYFSLGLIPLLSGFVMVCAGYYLHRNPPKDINKMMGYRSSRSMRSQEAWDFAQRYAAQLMMKWGLVSMLSVFPLGYFNLDEDTQSVMVLFIVVACSTAPILFVEKRLVEHFQG